MINPSDINILIAEDEPDLRDLLAAKFRVFGFNVETAHSGSSAWDKVLTIKDLHIVVTDVRMPDGTGYDLLQKCKDHNVAFPKVFVISAFSDIPKHQLYHTGAEGFMTKPFDTKVLLDVIRKSLITTEDRWKSPNSTQPKGSVELELGSLKNCLEQESFGVGRGGFYIQHSLPVNLSDQLISFNLKFDDGTLEGTGVVRWLYPDPTETNNKPVEYCGIEIAQLFGSSSEYYLGLLGDPLPKSYIACPESLIKEPLKS